MMPPVRAGLLLALLAIAGCDIGSPLTQPSGIERYGLIESPGDQSFVAAAIDIVMKVLPRDASVTLAPGWRPTNTGGAVLVFATTGDGLGTRELIATYQECGCVIVQAGALSDWLRSHVGSSGALLTVEPRLLLAYMLLHEVGHIETGESVADVPNPPRRATFNRDPAAQKERERRADTLAANTIRAALREEGTDRGLAAAGVAMALSQLSWNLAAHRMLDDFGGTALRKPALLWDAGMSHPNLEWRILTVNNLIQDTDTSRQLLEQFDDARSADPEPVYQDASK